ncbi:hypothetical protein [Allocoleopsis franciscana]|uniref:hypothetical protein n=1 Tax=Allocoleopsis franciscana TaxID=2886352 RepID=UPI0003146F53|nr:hypothetical protein [Allocoleopsis franciscana]
MILLTLSETRRDRSQPAQANFGCVDAINAAQNSCSASQCNIFRSSTVILLIFERDLWAKVQ